MRLSPLVTIALCLVALRANPASTESAVLTPQGKLNETLKESVNVSGSGFTLIGLRRGDAPGVLAVDGLSVEIPAGAKGMLCFRMTTRDGRYIGSRDYAVGSRNEQHAELDLKSEHKAELRAFAAQDLATRAEVRENCDSGSAGYFTPTTFAPGDHSDLLVVDLATKSSTPDASLLSSKGSILAHTTCSEIVGGARTAYDHECRLHVPPDLWSSTAMIRVNVVGLTGSSRQEDYSVRLGPL